MEESGKSEAHLTSAAAFVEGGIQEACDDACSICLEAFCDSDPSTMANMAISATDLLTGRIVAILEHEGTTITGARDEVEEIKQEFLSMQAFLADAETNTAKTKGEILWVASIRDLAYDVEDIIDEFMYHMYEKQSGGRLPRGLQKTISAPQKLWFRRKIAKKCQKLNEMIKAIPVRNQRYGVGHLGGAATSEDIHKLVQNQAESSIFIMEDELVGIEGKKQILMGWLMDEEQHQTIISVVGMGGSGKTTLAAKAFYNERLDQGTLHIKEGRYPCKFECHEPHGIDRVTS
ncbi:hypothetical protein ACLB2K_012036 [Fragaria x ananassa]